MNPSHDRLGGLEYGLSVEVMNSKTIRVRRLSSGMGKEAADWHAVYELCCRTGNGGTPIARDRWEFFGRLWVEPYKNIFPQWTYVAEAESAIIGYLTGCPDTLAFAKVKFWSFSLPLLVDVIRGRYRRNQDARRFVRRIFGLEKGPERVFPRGLSRKIRQDYPAHLHMNVEAGWRGSGVGTELVEKFFSDLRSAGIPAVHLYCGADPLEFYRHLGFTELAKITFCGAVIHVVGCRFRD